MCAVKPRAGSGTDVELPKRVISTLWVHDGIRAVVAVPLWCADEHVDRRIGDPRKVSANCRALDS